MITQDLIHNKYELLDYFVILSLYNIFDHSRIFFSSTVFENNFSDKKVLALKILNKEDSIF